MRRWAVVGLAVLATGCAEPAGTDARDVPAPYELIVPPAPYYGLAWTNKGIVLVRDELTAPFGPFLSRLDPQNGRIEPLTLPASDCRALRIVQVEVLRAGDLGLADICWDDQQAERPYTTEFLALDAAGSRELLGTFAGSARPVQFAWNATLASAVYEVEGSLCATLFTHTPDGRDRPLSATATVSGELVELGEDIDANDDRCTRTGRAARPEYGPDGETLALLASAAGGRTGQDRIDSPWGLVVIAPDGVPRTIMEGFLEPYGIAWLSADELLVSGTFAGEEGVWRVRVAGGEPERAASLALASLSLSPDGQSFAGFRASVPSNGPPSRETASVLVYQVVR